MPTYNYIYSFNYPENESDLCKLESRHIFDTEEKDKMLFSDIKIDPSSSAFIKKRVDVSLYSDNYEELIRKIEEENIRIDGFKVEYVVLEGDATEYSERLEKLRDVGFAIKAAPDYYKPKIMFALCYHDGTWFFGTLIKDDFEWHKHNQKPCSFSNSIGQIVAKALVNIASRGIKDNTLIDSCCGVGTVLLEACFSGFDIEGCDINWKAYKHTKTNLEHYNYSATVYRSDIKDIHKKYDAAIIDLPYNMYAYSNDEITANIIESTSKIANRIVIVSTSDIEGIITKADLTISDTCVINKAGSLRFARKIWVCEKHE
ncbi:methyltransferase (plasmid) [Fulvitalea axinellae]|uniref:Methyltransferase n=1 Tax=Fulvitalea axinellae TaxID=1182444 RepID=A0AAU9CXM0_9BACT|nr:methyltransferase [Fulvitalea axinellae]